MTETLVNNVLVAEARKNKERLDAMRESGSDESKSKAQIREEAFAEGALHALKSSFEQIFGTPMKLGKAEQQEPPVGGQEGDGTH